MLSCAADRPYVSIVTEYHTVLFCGVLCCRWPKTMFLKALGPFLACVIGIVVVVAGKWTNGKGPIKVCVHAGYWLLLLLGYFSTAVGCSMCGLLVWLGPWVSAPHVPNLDRRL